MGEKLHEWLKKEAKSKRAEWLLGVISFAESSFFPIPPDPFLVASLLIEQKRWLRHSLVVALSSVLGGLAGYAIGFWFFQEFGTRIVEAYDLHEELQTVSELFADNAFLTMFIAAFTPIPYKIFTIAAGLFHINVVTFLVASLVGRVLRFLCIGYLMKLFGPKIGELVFKYFNIATAGLLVVIVGYIITVLI